MELHQSIRGKYRYLFCIKDHFSKFTGAELLKKKTMELSNSACRKFITSHGAPKFI